MPPLETSFDFRREQSAAVVTVNGQLDGNTSDAFGRFLAEHLAPGEKEVILDVTRLEFISSAGLREFIQLVRLLGQQKAKPAIFGVSGPVEHVLQVAGLEALFHRTDDLPSALRKVSGQGDKRPGLLGRLFGGSA